MADATKGFILKHGRMYRVHVSSLGAKPGGNKGLLWREGHPS